MQHARATARLQRLFRPRARPLRRPRPRRAREPVQRRQRHVPRAEHAAGLLAVHHVDARTRVGDARLRRTDSSFVETLPDAALAAVRRPRRRRSLMLVTRRARRAITTSILRAADGVPYWDAGAPGLAALERHGASAPADPFNDHEPVDSSAAAIAAQGLLRLGRCLDARGERRRDRYEQAGLRVLDTLLDAAAVSERRRPTSGAAAALGVSPAERLGPCAARREDAARRIESVGRLPRCARRRST